MKFEFLKNKNKERIYPVTHSDGVFVGEDSSDVLTDVLNNKADNTSLDLKEDKSNKVTTINDESTDEQYPSAKAVHSTYATKEELREIELFKFPNATIIGTPTINNGQVSNFSAQNYMKFPFIVNMQGRPFSIDIAFTTGSDVTNQQNILDGADHGLAFAIKNSKFVIVLGSKSGEWDISNGEKASSATVSPNTSYRVRISWDGSAYKFEYSTNGETYTEDTALRINSSLSLYPTQIYIGTTASLLGHFTGIINMNYCSLTISDKVIWTGMDDVGLATRMAVDMSNIDEAGVEKVKEIVAPDIPTVNNATLTIQKNGANVGTFTANASSNSTVNITMNKSDVGLGNADNTADVNKNVASAVKATQDGDGNVITDTYATKNEAVMAKSGSTLNYIGGVGQYAYCKLARIKLNGDLTDFPITIDVSTRASLTSTLKILFIDLNNVVFTNDTYVHDNTGYSINSKYWLKKVENRVWELYGVFSNVWGRTTVHRVYGLFTERGNDIVVDILSEVVSSIPEGAIQAENYIYDTVEKSNYVDNAIACNLVKFSDRTLTVPAFVLYNVHIPTIKAGSTITLSFYVNDTTTFSDGEIRIGNSVVVETVSKSIRPGRNQITFSNIRDDVTNMTFWSNTLGTYSNFQLELGDTVHDFVPYTGDKGIINQEVADLRERIQVLETLLLNTTQE